MTKYTPEPDESIRLTGNFHQVPNSFVDKLVPTLTPELMRLVMMVYRETFGQGRDEWRVSNSEVGRRFGLKGETGDTRGLSRDKIARHIDAAIGWERERGEDGRTTGYTLDGGSGDLIRRPFGASRYPTCEGYECEGHPDTWVGPGSPPKDWYCCTACLTPLTAADQRDEMECSDDEGPDWASDDWTLDLSKYAVGLEVLRLMWTGYLSPVYYKKLPSRVPLPDDYKQHAIVLAKYPPRDAQPSWYDGYELPASMLAGCASDKQRRALTKEWNRPGTGMHSNAGRNWSKDELKLMGETLRPRMPHNLKFSEYRRLVDNFFHLPNSFEEVIAPNIPINLYPLLLRVWREEIGRLNPLRQTYGKSQSVALSYADIATLLGVSDSTAKRLVKWAVDYRFLECTTGVNAKNRYRIGEMIWRVVKHGTLPQWFKEEFAVQTDDGLAALGPDAATKTRRMKNGLARTGNAVSAMSPT